ncbi:hypothetical protein HK097_007436 [Rhizophlyctis rosea]|uniref:Uncharacterized protein n=1 Tax=Rhizophlyctis rosea TaxID=64517 RepID=A0AAD5X4K5_9FUNG|nr:hypothetical protein HK097_007436 [Rhizophlyctis rosea]
MGRQPSYTKESAIVKPHMPHPATAGPSETTLLDELSDGGQHMLKDQSMNDVDKLRAGLDAHPDDADEIFYEGVILSVTAYEDLSTFSRVMKTRSKRCGLYTKKVPVLLEISRSYIREYAINKDGGKGAVLSQMPAAFLGFALLRVTPDGRCRFLLKDSSSSYGGSDHRTYEVADKAELNTWYSKIKQARYTSTPSILTTETASEMHHTLPRSASELSMSDIGSDADLDIPTPPYDPIDFATYHAPSQNILDPGTDSDILPIAVAVEGGLDGMKLILQLESRIKDVRSAVAEERRENQGWLERLKGLEDRAVGLQGELGGLRSAVGDTK